MTHTSPAHAAGEVFFYGVPASMGHMRGYTLFFLLAAGMIVASLFFYVHTPTTVTAPPLPPPPAESAQIIPTLEERVGALFMIGHWSSTPLASTTALVSDLGVSGVILMDAPSNVNLVSHWIRDWQASTSVPLLIAIDQEGGSVSRLPGPAYVQTPQPRLTTAEDAYHTALTRGQALMSLGINTNMSPVLDASTNPTSFLYQRVFRNPALIATLGDAMVRGYIAAGVTAVPKHYPGHPDTNSDSHVTLPVVPGSVADYYTHTTHFADAIALGNIDILMTAHVLVPALDPTYPATLSSTILHDLRTRLGYTGVIMTDDLIMKAVTNTWTSDEAAVLALKAGADLLLFAAEPAAARTAYQAILSAVANGTLSEARITEAYERVMRLRTQR